MPSVPVGRTALGSGGALQGASRFLLCRLQHALGELHIFQRKVELLGIELLRAG